MRGVRAPHRRTAHTAHPPVRGCGVGCAVGGANPAPRRTVTSQVPGGWSATNGEPSQRYRTALSFVPSFGCHVIQRERPQPFPGMSRPATADLRAVAGALGPARAS